MTGDVSRNITLLLLLHLSVSGFLSLLNQDSRLLGCRTEVVALLQKDGEQGEGKEGEEKEEEEETEEEKGEDNNREKKKRRKRGAHVSYIGFLCCHQHNGHESHNLSKKKMTILIPLPSPL